MPCFSKCPPCTGCEERDRWIARAKSAMLEALAALKEHDSEYHYTTPPKLLALLQDLTK